MFKQVPAKPAVVKDEPISPPAVKQEPQAAGHKKHSGKDNKGGADEKRKRVIVKKEYDMPGQTKDTPLAVGGHTVASAPNDQCFPRNFLSSRRLRVMSLQPHT